jgi:hypothetical protein
VSHFSHACTISSLCRKKSIGFFRGRRKGSRLFVLSFVCMQKIETSVNVMPDAISKLDVCGERTRMKEGEKGRSVDGMGL